MMGGAEINPIPQRRVGTNTGISAPSDAPSIPPPFDFLVDTFQAFQLSDHVKF